MAEQRTTYGDEESKPTPPEPKYYKVEEHVIGDYVAAQELADKLFEPYGKLVDSPGGRTHPDAKVRVRARAKDFRVVLYKRIVVKVPEKKSVEDKEDTKLKVKGKAARAGNAKNRKGRTNPGR